MPVVPMREILDRAFSERYGVAAINVVDDLTLEAVLAAATDLQAPLIVQTSLKTVKSIGADAFYASWRVRADEVPVPVTLHLDHCPDREWVSTCLRTGWNSVLFDGSELDVAENTRQTIEVVAEADGYGAQVEGEIESVVGVEDGVGTEEGGEIHPVAVSAEFIVATGVYSFAPAIGTAHGLYKAEPKLTPERVTELVALHPIPMVLHGGTGLDRGAVHRPHRARVREGQHLDGAEDRVHRGQPRLPRREPRQARPAVAVRGGPRGRQDDGRAAHPHLRLRRTRGHPVGGRLTACRRSSSTATGCSPTRSATGIARRSTRPSPRSGCRSAGRRLTTPRSCRSAAARSGWPRCSPTTSCARTGFPPTTRAGRSSWPTGTGARPRPTRTWSRAGRLPARPGIARVAAEALEAGWTLAVASTSAEESVRAVLEHVVGAATAAQFAVFAGDVVPAKKPDPAIYVLALERARSRAGRRDRHRGLAQRPARRRRRRPALRRDGQQLHGRRGHGRGGPRRDEPGRPRQSRLASSPTAAPRGRVTSSPSPTSTRAVPAPSPRRSLYERHGDPSGRARRADDRPDRGRQRDVLLRARRGRRRRRLRLLARARLRGRPERLGRARVRRRRGPAQEDGASS